MPQPGQNIDLLQFVGGMDTDSPLEAIGKGWVRSAWDILWRGPVGNRRPESNWGTTLVPNALLPNTGTHKTIKALYDAVYKRVFFFNWNSSGKHGIYVYNTIAQPVATFQILLQTGINTVGDPLGFTLDRRISSADILYADAPIGPILFYVDTLGRPTQININRYLADTYPAVQRSYIDVIKAPPIMPPQVTYENDYTVQANGLINSLWKFAYAFFADNNEKTVISTASKQVLPTHPFDPTQNIDKSQNARLAVYVQTGDATIKSIRFYGKETKNGATSDWMILADIKKSDYNIADNSIYKFLFFNTGSYITEDPTFAVLDFDIVPLQANCQVLLNGNTPAYAGILENYDFFNPVLNVTASNQTTPRYTTNGALFFAATNGKFTGNQPQIQLFLTGCGNNDGFGNPTGLFYPPTSFVVRAKSGSTDISFSFTNVVLGDIGLILGQIQAAAVAAGWTFVTSDTNSITLYYPTGSITLQSSYWQGISPLPTFPYQTQQLAFFPQSAGQWGALYFDAAGRTNGVISNLQGQVTTPAYPGTGTVTPEITLDVSGYKPPLWAAYWRPVRTDNLTFDRYLDWISDAAYTGTSQTVLTQYAYFGVTNIFNYNTSIGATQGVISYGATSFVPGDRIRVLGRYAANGSFTALNLDYAILGVVVNPVVSGLVKTGTFIQISYPATDINANFKFDGTSDFQNYKILIYNYKAQNTASQNVFFEIGETFGIGNPGQPNAYHMGNVADNIVKISDGDIFFRPRTVPLQNEYIINTASFDQMTPDSTLHVNPGGGGTPIVDNGIWKIVGGTNQAAGILYPTFTNNDFTIQNEGGIPLSVRLRGTIPVVDKTDPNGQFALFVWIATASGVTKTQILATQTGLAPGVSNNFIFDATISLPPTGKLWIVSHAVNEMLIGGFPLTLDVIRNISIYVFDASFSDIYSLKTNSDNRPSEIDSTAKQAFFPTLFRFAEPYVPGTNIFQANRFFDVNKDEFDAGYGQVQRLIQWQRRLRVAQERKWGEVGVYSKFIKNNNGATQLIVNDQIIEQNNIQYFDMDSGIGNQPDCLAVNDFQIWYFDPVRGTFNRLSLDGIKQISEEFLVQTFAGSLTPAYLNNYAYPFGGNAVVLGVYNFTKDRYAETLFSFQPGTLGASTLPAQSIAFIEKTNVFSSYYRFAPDAMVCAENQLISFSQGQLYLHNDQGSNRTYYGTPILPQLELIFNDQEVIRKTYQALTYQPFNNKLWTAKNVGDITTSFFNPQTGFQQISNLIAQDFEIVEGQANAAFNRDANSGLNPALTINDGDYLKGYWMRVLLTAPDNGFNALFAPYVRWDPSMKTP
jgi:hypothetical protein